MFVVRSTMTALLATALCCTAARAEEPAEPPHLLGPVPEAIEKMPSDVNAPMDDDLKEKMLKRYNDRKQNEATAQSNLAKAKQDGEDSKKKIDTTVKTQATGEVKVDEDTLKFTEPLSQAEAIGRKTVVDEKRPWDVNPQDFDIYQYERWSLNESDFIQDAPVYMALPDRYSHPVKYFAFTYKVSNSTAKARRIGPVFIAITDHNSFSPVSTGFQPLEVLARSSFSPRVGVDNAADKLGLADKLTPLEDVPSMSAYSLKDGAYKEFQAKDPVLNFEAGQMRQGAAIWRNFDDRFNELKIVVHGLGNAHKFDKRLRRVLVLNYYRNDDEFDVQRSELTYKGKSWEYTWMWDQEIEVPAPADAKDNQIKDIELATPAGGKRLVWSFPYTISNSSGTEQTITVKEVRFVLRNIEIEVAGQKVNLEVHVVDDGKSTIYKAQLLREISQSVPPKDTNRFAPDAEKAKIEGLTYKIEIDKKIAPRPAVFDVNDVDWNMVRDQCEIALFENLDKKASSDKKWSEINKDAKDNEKVPLYEAHRTLTPDTVTLNDGRVFTGDVVYDSDLVVGLNSPTEGKLEFDKKTEVKSVELGEFSKVKEQVLKKIPDALAAQKKAKQVVAFFNCFAGISSGTYRVSRSYRQRVDPAKGWEKEWEQVLK